MNRVELQLIQFQKLSPQQLQVDLHCILNAEKHSQSLDCKILITTHTRVDIYFKIHRFMRNNTCPMKQQAYLGIESMLK